jgi:integrase
MFADFLNRVPPGKKGRFQKGKQLTLLKTVFNYAIGTLFWMDANPISPLKLPKSKPRTRYITDEEYDGIRAIAPLRIRLAMELAYLTGQRQSDVIHLRWKDIDDAIHFVQGKTGKKVGIRIGPKLEKVLDECWQLPHGGATGGEWVLPRSMGGCYTSEGFRAGWQRLSNEWCRRGNVRMNYHDLRAKCVSDSKSLQEASERAGHVGQQMTKRVYDRRERVVDSLA